ncbi:MAG TPA: SDR family oxidoreductase [Polyangiaceae bacterium]
MTDAERPLLGKRALVTGAGKRLGRAIAVALGRAGAHVAVHYRSSLAEAEETCALIRAAGGEASSLAADLADRDACRALADRAVAALGGLDLVVPSAANFERVAYDQIDDDAWDRSLSLDLGSPFALVHRATPALRAARGSVVFITCASTTAPFRNHLPYVVAKGALAHLMRTLALELAPDVRVNAVAPGTVLPPESMSSGALASLVRQIPLGHHGNPEDIASAVLYLASAPFVTGQEITVDGGRHLSKAELSP